MKVLVIGSGGREHALLWKLAQSPERPELYCAPGNAGTAQLATNVPLAATNIGALALWAVENRVDLTIVGPEAPLAEGLVNMFTEHGLRVFGPTKEASRLEWSKSFGKEVMRKAGVRTAAGEEFEDFGAAAAYIDQRTPPYVIKADGLAAGKGVVIAPDKEQAMAALRDFLQGSKLGTAGQRVVIEDFLEGAEASVMAMVDASTVVPLVVSQDYKRVFDGDAGPNTGGMGAISPTPVLSDMRVEMLVGDIFLPVIRELWNRNIRYTGFLYAGVLVDRSGAVNVLEFNCRLGDPETQVLMMRLSSDLLGAVNAAVNDQLSSVELHWKNDAAACVVACSKGYPGDVEDGKRIDGLFPGDENLQIFHSGTVHQGDPNENPAILSRGGRILTVTALGNEPNRAVRHAYFGMSQVSFEGMHYRRDIGGGVW